MNQGTVYRHNPYTIPVDRWTDDKVTARRDMPVNGQGHIVQPKFMLRTEDARAHTVRWRAWSERWPQHLWPNWLASWLEANPA